MIKADAGEHPGKENGMTVQEMIARQRQITDQARSEGRDLTEAEKTEFDRLQRQIDAGDGNRGAATGGQEHPASLLGKRIRSGGTEGGSAEACAWISEIPGTLPEIRSGPGPVCFQGRQY